MGQYKVCVYAICKNEEKFVDGWMDSMGEADLVVVLDTGSEDGTVERLRARGAQVTVERILPWRFDAARNRSLELVPEDVDLCVCTDLDEAFHPGWREALERAWRPGCGRASYRYTWSFQQDGSEGVVFWSDKIHARRGYRWVHPVHEVLQWEGEGAPGPTVAAEGIQLDHHPDPEKSRGQYLPLLELSVEEDPEDDRNMHYLGREYLFRGRWKSASAPWSAIWPCRRRCGGTNGRPPCAFWHGPALNWTVRTRRWSGISGLRRRPPIFGSHGWSWPVCCTSGRSGTVCCMPPVRRWRSKSDPAPTSASRRRGAACPMICAVRRFTIRGGPLWPWRRHARHWPCRRRTGDCGKMWSCWSGRCAIQKHLRPIERKSHVKLLVRRFHMAFLELWRYQ